VRLIAEVMAAGTLEARQPDRDRTEQGRDPVEPVVFDLARGAAEATRRPLAGMVLALGGDDRLLNPGQKQLALRVRQAQNRKIAQITGAVDLQHVDTAGRTFGSDLHQAQYPLFPIPSRLNTRPGIPGSAPHRQTLDGPLAQREPEREPDSLLDDGGRKLVTSVRNRLHPSRLPS
jgi:hypothetical protein